MEAGRTAVVAAIVHDGPPACLTGVGTITFILTRMVSCRTESDRAERRTRKRRAVPFTSTLCRSARVHIRPVDH